MTHWMTVADLRKHGMVPVTLVEAAIVVAPFSRRKCIWFEWVFNSRGSPGDQGYSLGASVGHKDGLIIKAAIGELSVCLRNVMLYLEPSFHGTADVQGQKKFVLEYCLEPNRTYYAFAEKFTYHQPPRPVWPCFPRKKSTWLTAIADGMIENTCPMNPLIPTRRDRTG